MTIVGSGYVGLVTGACLADAGHHVEMVDVDAERIALLEAGGVPFYEPGLELLLERARARGTIGFTTDAAAAVSSCEAVFLAVPTPSRPDGSCDTSVLLAVAAAIAPHCRPNATVIVKSTVAVGTTDRVQELLDAGSSHPLYAAMNPEFLREGTAVRDCQLPDRVAVGTHHERAREALRSLFEPFVDDDRPLIFTDPRSAELCKYAANAYLAMRIAFVNEIARLSHQTGADIDAVRKIVGADRRIGNHYFHPGPGYGGACFPKDVRALAAIGRESGRALALVEATHTANEDHRAWVVEQIRQALGPELEGKRLAVWGLAFKASSDDCRESIARQVIATLAPLGVRIAAFDPEADAAALGPTSEQVERFASSPLDAARDADAVAVLTEWPLFATAPFPEVAAAMRGDAVIDARNMLQTRAVRAAGLRYLGIGRRR